MVSFPPTKRQTSEYNSCVTQFGFSTAFALLHATGNRSVFRLGASTHDFVLSKLLIVCERAAGPLHVALTVPLAVLHGYRLQLRFGILGIQAILVIVQLQN